MSRPMSKTAKLQADRAIRNLATKFAGVEFDGGIDGDNGEALKEASYEEAMNRNVYQSEDWMDEWLDWRTYVENGVLEALGWDSVLTDPAPVSGGDHTATTETTTVRCHGIGEIPTLDQLTADARTLRTEPGAAYLLAARYNVTVKTEDTERDVYRRVHKRLTRLAGHARTGIEVAA